MNSMKTPCMLAIVVVILFTIQVSSRGEECVDDTDCNEKNNERCQRFDACTLGECVCKEDYTTWRQHPSSSSPPQGFLNVCLKLKKIGESCDNETETCGYSTKCWQGQCECLDASSLEQASDKINCVNKVTKTYLGPNGNCTSQPYNYCQGGTTCVSDNKCQCHDESEWNENLKTCIHKKSKMGLGEGKVCTSSISSANQWSTSYYNLPQQICAENMICKNCPGEGHKGSSARNFCLKVAENGASAKTMNYGIALLLALIVLLKAF